MGPTQMSPPANILTATPQQTHPRSGEIFYYLVFPEKRESLLVFKGPAWHGTGSNLNQTLIEKFPVLICIIFLSCNWLIGTHLHLMSSHKIILYPFSIKATLGLQKIDYFHLVYLLLFWFLTCCGCCLEMFALFQLFKLDLSELAEN